MKAEGSFGGNSDEPSIATRYLMQCLIYASGAEFPKTVETEPVSTVEFSQLGEPQGCSGHGLPVAFLRQDRQLRPGTRDDNLTRQRVGNHLRSAPQTT